MKTSRIRKDVLETTHEITRLVKYSPKRDAKVKQIRNSSSTAAAFTRARYEDGDAPAEFYGTPESRYRHVLAYFEAIDKWTMYITDRFDQHDYMFLHELKFIKLFRYDLTTKVSSGRRTTFIIKRFKWSPGGTDHGSQHQKWCFWISFGARVLVGIIMITFMIGLICNEKCMKEAII